jgi:hypothetical protein
VLLALDLVAMGADGRPQCGGGPDRGLSLDVLRQALPVAGLSHVAGMFCRPRGGVKRW